MRHRHPSAFSLLELIIVLVVMVGLMAIVWPNLQRPLNRTSLDEATQMVRSAIDESRYQSTVSGAPWFLKLEVGAPSMTAGTFDAFVQANDGSLTATAPLADDTDQASSEDSTSSPQLRSWKLPDNIVISDVQWQAFASAHTEGRDETDGMDALNDDQNVKEFVDKLDARAPSEVDQPMPMLAQEDAPNWLPILATGRGRDATIVVHDNLTHESAQIVFVSATGAIEVMR